MHVARVTIQRKKIVISEKTFSEIVAPECGAVVLFLGIVRNRSTKNPATTRSDSRLVNYLEYDVYKEMAEEQIQNIRNKALKKFQIKDAKIIHRIGKIKVGEIAIMIAVSGAHRKDAFKAGKYIIDNIKKSVPIWKKEVTIDGEYWIEGE